MTVQVWSADEIRALVSVLKDWACPPIFSPSFRRRDNALSEAIDDFVATVTRRMQGLCEDELRQVVDGLPTYSRRELGELRLGDPANLDKLAEQLIVAAADEVYHDERPYIFGDGHQSRSKVLARHPELRSQFDDDGLLRCSDAMHLTNYYISYKDSWLHYSPLLRRGFSSGINADFTFALARARLRNEANIAVGIDHDRLARRGEILQVEEYAYWFGPQLQEGWLDDPACVGRTTYGYEKIDALYAPCRKLEVLQYLDKNNSDYKIIAVEEVIDPTAKTLLDAYSNRQYVPNRYVHCIRDMRRKVFVHLDLAYRLYHREGYDIRLDGELPSKGGFARKKVCRLDGEVASADWAALVGAFFRDNSLIYELVGIDSQDVSDRGLSLPKVAQAGP